MRIPSIRPLLTASLITVLVAGSRSARSQPAPTSSAAAAVASAPSDAPIVPTVPATVRLLDSAVEKSLDESGARANELAGKANGLLLEGRSAEAEELYREAWALKPSYDIGGNLGLAEVEAGEHREAAQHLLFALRRFPVSSRQEPVERLRKLIATERTHLVMLLIEVNVAGAEVLVDDTSVGVAPLRDELFVEPGDRRVQARRNGYVAAEASVPGEVGTAWRVSLALKREPPPSPPPRIPDALPPREPPPNDWPIRFGVVGALMTTALLVIVRTWRPWFTRMRVRLSRRWKRLHPGRRRLAARAHRRLR